MKQNIITTLHRTIAYVLLTSQLLTSCCFHETIVPHKEQPPQEIIGLSDDNPIAEPPIAYTSTLATVSDQGYAANDISQSFEIHNYTTREGHKIRLIEDGDHYVAQVEENLPTGFSSRLPLLPVHSQQGLYLENLTSFTYVEVVLPRQANDNKGYVVCVRQLGLLGGMPPSKADPNCDYKAHEYKQNINGDWVCPSGQHTVSAPPAYSSSSGSGYPPNKDFNDFVRKQRERDAARKRNWDAQRDADMWNRLNNPRHSHNESGFGHSAPRQTCISDFDQEVQDETERRIRANKRLSKRIERGDVNDYSSRPCSMGHQYESTNYDDIVRDLKERREREREREREERKRLDQEARERENRERLLSKHKELGSWLNHIAAQGEELWMPSNLNQYSYCYIKSEVNRLQRLLHLELQEEEQLNKPFSGKEDLLKETTKKVSSLEKLLKNLQELFKNSELFKNKAPHFVDINGIFMPIYEDDPEIDSKVHEYINSYEQESYSREEREEREKERERQEREEREREQRNKEEK